eukprot:873863_1
MNKKSGIMMQSKNLKSIIIRISRSYTLLESGTTEEDTEDFTHDKLRSTGWANDKLLTNDINEYDTLSFKIDIKLLAVVDKNGMLLSRIVELQKERAQLQKKYEQVRKLNEELSISGTERELTMRKISEMQRSNDKLKEENDKLKDEEKEYQMMIEELKKANKILKYKSLQARSYEEWDTEDIVMWIRSLDNGRLAKYEEKLRDNLVTEGVLGHDLKDVDSGDIRNIYCAKYKN